MIKLEKCKCGNSVEINHSMSMECYGRSWQLCEVVCSRKECAHSVSTTIDAANTREYRPAMKQLIKSWNMLQKEKNK